MWIDFERADGEVRGLGVSVNGSQGAYACHFVYGPSIEAIEGPFAQQPHTVMRPLGLAEAPGLDIDQLWRVAVGRQSVSMGAE